MDKLAFLFPGQGSQYVGMGMDLATKYKVAADVFAEADRALDFSLREVMWDGPAEHLAQTAITQPAILAVSVAITRVLAANGSSPRAAMGLSLGEYSALVAADSLSFSTAIRLVHQRGRLMQEAVPLGQGAVAVIMGLATPLVEEVCAGTAGVVLVANYNCPGQVAVAGEVQSVEAVMQKCSALGAKRVVKLPVSAPFHTPLLGGAGEALRPHLEKSELKPPQIPVVNNVTAEYFTGDDLVSLLVRQVSSPVRFEDCVRRLLADGFMHFVEIGPGATLGSFVRRIEKSATVYTADTAENIEKFLEVPR
ncbi:MAG: Malonyl CoA-acyl carrier protein transacylase [Firmicutes bacterium]|nr:Malonyl CoA-acyl carrier protein transacylase [Bacillota bacterium]MBT9158195.1 Malonyl CoA-acyl carrier protein transacylase [Bacillota bacterium]